MFTHCLFKEVTAMKDSTNEIKDNKWNSINVLIVTLTMFGGIMFLMYTSGITTVLFKIGLPVNIVLVLLYKIHKKYGHLKIPVIVLRIIAIIIFVSGFIAPVILINFNYTKSMYPVKRFCYNYGVHNIGNFLPESMPEKCDDYLFITKGSIPAQDYHADAYLIFHTDKNTLKNYEEHFNSYEKAERHTAHMSDKENSNLWLKCPEELPRHVFSQLQSEHIHDFEKAIIYKVPAYYSKGCMLDYDSGLAVFWY
ncbi:MAG: hypothetical protein K2J39_08775 [Ruminococcus sp.]|nr:hypothetical protein [Ruminococcus sp.]